MQIKDVISKLTLEEKASLCSGQGYWHTQPIADKKIPAILMCDGPVGLRKQNKMEDNLGLYDSVQTVCFPSTSTLANSFSRESLALIGQTLGSECQAQNVSMLLGPGMNIKRNPLGGRNFEYYSEDPYLTGELASSYVTALQGKGVAACTKHFAGNNQETYRMSGNSIIEERPLHEIYLAAFEKVVKQAHPRAIMCAYNALNGTFCSENKSLLTDILRDRWGFNGLVVTDWGAVKNRVKGLLAGVDLEMPGGSGAQDKNIIEAVRSGKLDEKILDKAVLNILTFVNQSINNQQRDATTNLDQDHQIAVKLAVNSAVLMKNNNNLLPLNRDKQLAFIGEFAEKPRYQGGGSSHVNSYHVDTALNWARSQHLNINYAQGYDQDKITPNSALIEEAVSLAKKSDVAIIFAGLPESIGSEGADRQSMAMPENQNALIMAVTEAQPNTVVVLHTGSAVEMPWQNNVAAILNMGLAGEGVGSATGKLLFGENNPSGRLSETYPYHLEDSPSFLNFPGEEGTVHYRENIFVGYRYYDKKKLSVAFPFGSGLSYTNFTYSNLQTSSTTIKDTDQATISCLVKNEGNYTGQEVVQLYVEPGESAVLRPQRELKNFTKVLLQPGECKRVSFTLDKETFAYYNDQIHNWHVESNSYTLSIGPTSHNLPLSVNIQVTSTVPIPIHYTSFTAIGKVVKNPLGKKVVLETLREVLHVTSKQYQESSTSDQKKIDQQCEPILQSALTMPLSSLVSLGSMKSSDLSQLITNLNTKSSLKK